MCLCLIKTTLTHTSIYLYIYIPHTISPQKGFTRSLYDDIPNFRGPTFDYHKDKDHDFWTYVYFYVYLKRKDKTAFSGAESYVWKLINESNLSWIPNRSSAAIQNYHHEALTSSSNNGGDGGGVDNEARLKEFAAQNKMIEQMAEDMMTLKTVVGSVDKKLKLRE
jgi:hypothetical protein